ncbi:MAG: NAD(P)H-dependent oxidoreductase subunit E [Bacteroidetes bacterium]|nr:NAD(P)H-dependent oxidoreductase subunit E [Bacteroidota bacterium]
MKKKKQDKSQDRSKILDCLWDFQNQYGYIRDEDVAACSKDLDISQVELEGVISFYHFFHRQPAGQITIYLNNSIVSECKGFQRVKEAFERETGASFGGIDPSGQFGLYETACIGLSDQEPAALINFYPFTNLNTLKVRSIIARLKKGESPASFCDKIEEKIRWKPPKDKTIFFRDYYPGIAVSKLKDYSPEKIIEEIKKSKLSGMGGAFFPTGLKWEFCKNQPASPKYIVCNADEGEPGTFKDRALMNEIPGLMLEGMTVAGYAVGANQGIIYLRAEYIWLKEKLEQTLSHFRKMNLLGENVGGIKGFDFDIRIQLGAGAYVCGEETALLNSLEGKRGEPRTKQFFPTEKGFLHLPTVVNNVETFCAAARIIELGSEFYLNTGTANSPGTKLLSVSGDCHLPGIYEIEWGTQISDILEKCQATDPYFIQVSGPSGQCISNKELNRTIAKDDLPCGGSFMIFNENRDVLNILINFSEFFKHESCGVCTPCRAGNFIIQRKLNKISAGLAYSSDFEEVKEWGNIMKVTSRCGLGKAATNSLLMALDKFPEYFQSKVDHHKEGLNKAFHLEQAVQEYEKFNN